MRYMVPTTALRINSKIKLAIAKYYSFNVFFCETKQISIKADKLCIQPGIKKKKIVSRSESKRFGFLPH